MLKEIKILVMKYSSIAAILEKLKIYTTLNIIISAKDKIETLLLQPIVFSDPNPQ